MHKTNLKTDYYYYGGAPNSIVKQPELLIACASKRVEKIRFWSKLTNLCQQHTMILIISKSMTSHQVSDLI